MRGAKSGEVGVGPLDRRRDSLALRDGPGGTAQELLRFVLRWRHQLTTRPGSLVPIAVNEPAVCRGLVARAEAELKARPRPYLRVAPYSKAASLPACIQTLVHSDAVCGVAFVSYSFRKMVNSYPTKYGQPVRPLIDLGGVFGGPRLSQQDALSTR